MSQVHKFVSEALPGPPGTLFPFRRPEFEGVCVNYRHPDPRRVRKGGSELRLLTPDPGDWRDWRENS